MNNSQKYLSINGRLWRDGGMYLRNIVYIIAAAICFNIQASWARVCFLPAAEFGCGDVLDIEATCESQGGYDTEDLCSKGKKNSQICYPNNDCYYRKCQYNSKADCEKHVNINRYECLWETVGDTTCYYAVAKSCSEIDSEYKSSYDSDTEYVLDTITDANGNNCYKTRKKYCSEMGYSLTCNASMYEASNKMADGFDGACYNCILKPCDKIGDKTLKSSCFSYENPEPAGITGKDGPCFKCTKKSCSAMGYKLKCNDKTETPLDSGFSSELGKCYVCDLKNCSQISPIGTYQKSCGENYDDVPSSVTGKDGACVTCKKKTCEGRPTSCATGFDFINQYTDDNNVTCGDCVDCTDESDGRIPCQKQGFYTCRGDGRVPDETSETCMCGGVTWYKRCLVEETCFKDTVGYCYGTTDKEFAEEFTYVGERCTKVDGTVVYDYIGCYTGSAPKCKGVKSKVAGKVECLNGNIGIGTPILCGGKEFYDTCDVDPCIESNVAENGGYCFASIYDYSDDGYYYVKDKCTKRNKTVVKLYANCTRDKDCEGNRGPAYGKKICPDNKGSGDMVECGGKKYFDSCEETCKTDYASYNGCIGTGGSSMYQTNMVKCTKLDGTKLYYYAECASETKDCEGNDAPAKGLRICPYGTFLGGKTVECGGYTYAEHCLTECNYEENAESCQEKGQTFNPKCKDNKDVWWGECQKK